MRHKTSQVAPGPRRPDAFRCYWCAYLHPHFSPFPRIASRPSLAMIGTITTAATGSAHHQPRSAFNSRPPKRIAERYVQKSVCLESALIAALSIPSATRRFALANNGINDNRNGSDCDARDAAFRFLVTRQSQARIEGYVNSERDETRPNDP